MDGQSIAGLSETISKENSSGPWTVRSTVSFNTTRAMAGVLICAASNGISPDGIDTTNLTIKCKRLIQANWPVNLT